jgi:hypothetical protein
MPKMLVTIVTAMTTNNKQRTTNLEKQTQTKPNLPATAGKFVPSAAEGPQALMAGKIALSVVEGPVTGNACPPMTLQTIHLTKPSAANIICSFMERAE